MLRWTLHLIDLQQQLVLLRLIGTWSRRLRPSTLANIHYYTKEGSGLARGKKRDRHTLVGKVANHFSGKPTKGDTLSFWITALYFLHHATDILRRKEWRLPFGTVSPLAVRRGLDGENNVVQCDRSLEKEDENPSPGGLDSQTNDCHTSKREQVSVKVEILCSAVKPLPSFLFFFGRVHSTVQLCLASHTI